jgi:hypothetical protein
MEASKKKKIIIWTSIAVILSVGGYLTYNYFKNRDKDKGDNTPPILPPNVNDETNSSSTNSSSTQVASEQNALAIQYRLWANSTDSLSKKYGKKSQFDLDATSQNPYGGTFLKSYAAGKNDYEANLFCGNNATFPLTLGSKGKQVKELQNFLNNFGSGNKIAANCIFDNETKAKLDSNFRDLGFSGQIIDKRFYDNVIVLSNRNGKLVNYRPQ